MPDRFEFEKFELSKTPLNQLCVDFVKSQLGRLTFEVAMHSGAALAGTVLEKASVSVNTLAANAEQNLSFIAHAFSWSTAMLAN
jgi:hypothetical protein